ncbi:hypothetical protein HK100_008476 [Physocladia obscura]|uniref:Uncharacterized protein n=1 Tax=Physocladia obscura TaxID=109957 RepID=A0AAD5T449_9FUNG|nr:hypothetical protein HK100_008476 [Physocladia obscura]
MAIALARQGDEGKLAAPKFRPIYTQDLQLTRSVNCTHDIGIPVDKSIYSVAFKFIIHDCKASADNPTITSVSISNAILLASHSKSPNQESLLQHLDLNLATSLKTIISKLVTDARYKNSDAEQVVMQFETESEETVQELIETVDNTNNIEQTVTELNQQTRVSTDSPGPKNIDLTESGPANQIKTITRTLTIIIQKQSIPSTTPNPAVPVILTAQKRQASGANDLDERFLIKKMKTDFDQVTKIAEILKDAPTDLELTEGAYNLF